MTLPARAQVLGELRLAIFASLLIWTLRLGLNLVPRLAAPRLDAVIDLGWLLTLAAVVHGSYRLARDATPASARLLRVAVLAGALELGLCLALWALRSFTEIGGHEAELSVVALLAWAVARAGLFMSLFALAVEAGRAPPAPFAAVVPLAAGLRALLFLGTLLSPYLESGSEARRLFLATTETRAWIAAAALLIVEGAIAYLAGRLRGGG